MEKKWSFCLIYGVGETIEVQTLAYQYQSNILDPITKMELANNWGRVLPAPP